MKVRHCWPQSTMPDRELDAAWTTAVMLAFMQQTVYIVLDFFSLSSCDPFITGHSNMECDL